MYGADEGVTTRALGDTRGLEELLDGGVSRDAVGQLDMGPVPRLRRLADQPEPAALELPHPLPEGDPPGAGSRIFRSPSPTMTSTALPAECFDMAVKVSPPPWTSRKACRSGERYDSTTRTRWPTSGVRDAILTRSEAPELSSGLTGVVPAPMMRVGSV